MEAQVFYHVLVEVETRRTEREVARDLTEDEMVNQFVLPYRRGDSISIQGRFFPRDHIKRLLITRSPVPAWELLTLSERSVYQLSRDDVAAAWLWTATSRAEQVTGEYISAQSASAHAGTDVAQNPQTSSNVLLSSADRTTVFIVNGWNHAARDAMIKFVQALGLTYLSWERAVEMTGSASPETWEVVRVGLSRAQAIVVVVTGDDLARPNFRFARPGESVRLEPQPRPNVWIEIGAALSINRTRTILALFEPVRQATDIIGLNYVSVSNSEESRDALLSRLRTAQCEVQAQDKIYLDPQTAGDFEAAVADARSVLNQDDRIALEALSNRDACILKLLEKFESTHPLKPGEAELDRTFRFWSDFRLSAATVCGIIDDDIDSILRKLASTELYESYRPHLLGDASHGRKWAGKLTGTYYRVAPFVSES